MWIREQNKRALAKCESFIIVHSNNNYVVKGCVKKESDSLFDINLGRYSTLEKAIKVLDEIQVWIDEGDIYICENGVEYSKTSKTVFQMPQDDEVK